MFVNIIIGGLLLYMFLLIVTMFMLSFEKNQEIEMYKGKPRYKHLRDGWYGEVEVYDRKTKKVKVF